MSATDVYSEVYLQQFPRLSKYPSCPNHNLKEAFPYASDIQLTSVTDATPELVILSLCVFPQQVLGRPLIVPVIRIKASSEKYVV